MTRLSFRQWARPLAIGIGAAMAVSGLCASLVNLVFHGAVL